jgi:hypothetical protein
MAEQAVGAPLEWSTSSRYGTRVDVAWVFTGNPFKIWSVRAGVEGAAKAHVLRMSRRLVARMLMLCNHNCTQGILTPHLEISKPSRQFEGDNFNAAPQKKLTDDWSAVQLPHTSFTQFNARPGL